jgi:hypothetical protein
LDQCIDLFWAEHKKLLSQYRHHKSTCGRSDEKKPGRALWIHILVAQFIEEEE